MANVTQPEAKNNSYLSLCYYDALSQNNNANICPNLSLGAQWFSGWGVPRSDERVLGTVAPCPHVETPLGKMHSNLSESDFFGSELALDKSP